MAENILKKLSRFFLIVAFLLTQSTVSLAQTPNSSNSKSDTAKAKSVKSEPAKRAKGKVVPSEQAIDAEIAFYSGDFAKASSLLDALSQSKDKDFALWHNQLGSIYLAAEDYKQALGAFLDAHYLMNDTAAFSKLESHAVALTGAEREKAYKGDPYEKVYNSLYIALLLEQENDYDNSLAAVKNGLLCDSDVEGGLYKSDATLLYLLGARLEALRNNSSVSDEYLQKATEAYALSHPVNRGVVSEEQGKMTLLSQKQKELEKLMPKTTASDSKKDENKATKPSKKSKKVLALEDEIQKLGSFNTIFFDDYFPFSEEEVTQIKGGIKELQSMTKQIQELLDEHKKIFQRIKLTDREIEEFHKHLSSRSDYTEQNVLNFANNLKDAESITEEQYQKMVSSFKVTQKGKEYNPLRGDRLVQFVDLCLEKHMKQDARISFYVDYQEYQKKRKDFRIYLEGKYNINYTEKVIPIKVPENCNYYTGNKAVIVVIEKND